MLRSTRKRRQQRVEQGLPPIAPWHRRTRAGILIVLAGGLILAVNGAAFAFLESKGLPIFGGTVATANPDATAEEPPETSLTLVSGVTTPASSLMSTFEAVQIPGWESVGGAQRATDQPLATMCPVYDEISPVVSSRGTFRSLNEASGEATVTIQVYGAGVGAQAFNEERAAAQSCRNENGYVSYAYDSPVPGALDSFRVTVHPDGTPSYDVIGWRNGDVTAYISYAPGTDVSSLISGVSGVINSTINESCIDPTYMTSDSTRNPWSRKYTGFQIRETLEVTPSPEIMADLMPVPANIDLPTVTPVQIPTRPADPVWPEELPEPVDMPKQLRNPGVMPDRVTVPRQVQDLVGPGCGWAFTGVNAPPFNQEDSDREFAAIRDEAVDKVVEEQAQWAKATEKFWKRYDGYLLAAKEYSKYAKEVNVVATAWNAIQAERDAYAVAVREYEQDLADRAKFIRDQADAQRKYDESIAWCAVNPSPAPIPTPEPTVVGYDEFGNPIMSEPVVIEQPVWPCPPKQPAILDKPIPEEPIEPTPPANPIPEEILIERGEIIPEDLNAFLDPESESVFGRP